MKNDLTQKVERDYKDKAEVDGKINRRRFLRGLAGLAVGGVVVLGGGYLGYETFREPTLKERIVKGLKELPNQNDVTKMRMFCQIMRDSIYNNPSEAKEYIINQLGITSEEYENRFSQLIRDGHLNEGCKDFWKRHGAPLDNFGKNITQDKLAIAVYDDYLW